MLYFSQRDPHWSADELGWGPPGSKIGTVGCDETCDAMVAHDAFADLAFITPRTLNLAYIAARDYSYSSGGDYDLLTDNALAKLWPSRFSVTTVWGYDQARVDAAVRSSDTYVKLWISTASVPTHFVLAAGGNLIIDPWYGKIGYLSGYGGPKAVRKMIFVKKLPPVAAPVPAPAPKPAPVPVPVPVPTPIPTPKPVPTPPASVPVYATVADNGLAITRGVDESAVLAYSQNWQTIPDNHGEGFNETKDGVFVRYFVGFVPGADAPAEPHPLPASPPAIGLSPQMLAAIQMFLIFIGRLLARERR